VLGYTDRDDCFRDLNNSWITGRYAEAELHDRLIDLGADIAWFPAVWPETYSFTLSAALAAGILPAAFDFGAIASRLREIGWASSCRSNSCWIRNASSSAFRQCRLVLSRLPFADTAELR